MRIGCSKSQHDLCYNLHVSDDASCRCGAEIENATHYFFQYAQERTRLFQLQVLPNITRDLLYDNETLSLDQNQAIFQSVHDFITDNKRFD